MTQRKYPTLAEFEELKEAVGRIEEKVSRASCRPSIYVDPGEAGARIGITDANGLPVTVGDYIAPVSGGKRSCITSVALRLAGRKGGAFAVCVDGDNHGRLGTEIVAVDGMLPNHVLSSIKEATA